MKMFDHVKRLFSRKKGPEFARARKAQTATTDKQVIHDLMKRAAVQGARARRSMYAIGGVPDGGAIGGSIAAMTTSHERWKRKRRAGI